MPFRATGGRQAGVADEAETDQGHTGETFTNQDIRELSGQDQVGGLEGNSTLKQRSEFMT